jgi:hypothetical protein
LKKFAFQPRFWYHLPPEQQPGLTAQNAAPAAKPIP